MAFSIVSMAMLFVVMIYYWRMVEARKAARQRTDQITHWLEKTAIFEQVADDRSALRTIQEALEHYPGHPSLLKKEQQISARLDDDAAEDDLPPGQ